VKLEDVNIYDPDLYVEAVPHEAFALLRSRDPVFWQERPRAPATGLCSSTPT
jgi:hypothetical protein